MQYLKNVILNLQGIIRRVLPRLLEGIVRKDIAISPSDAINVGKLQTYVKKNMMVSILPFAYLEIIAILKKASYNITINL